MVVYDRHKQEYINETEYKEDTIKFLYTTMIGRAMLNTVIARPYFSKLVAKYKKSEISRADIVPFIKKYNINTKPYKLSEMKSFNDFFIRKREIIENDTDCNDLVAIADAKLSVYNITNDLKLHVKNSDYSVDEIIGNAEIAKEYIGGKCIVFRMTVDDYHRYHFLDNGFIRKHYKIKGELHTVRPIQSKYKAFSRNCREVTLMRTDNFGDVVQVEVGATLVGCIKNEYKDSMFTKLQEKGHFEYGGSTIILFMKNNVTIDKDIEICSKHNIEVKVNIGEKIGRSKYIKLV